MAIFINRVHAEPLSKSIIWFWIAIIDLYQITYYN